MANSTPLPRQWFSGKSAGYQWDGAEECGGPKRCVEGQGRISRRPVHDRPIDVTPIHVLKSARSSATIAELIANKRALGRPKDLADIDMLQQFSDCVLPRRATCHAHTRHTSHSVFPVSIWVLFQTPLKSRTASAT